MESREKCILRRSVLNHHCSPTAPNFVWAIDSVTVRDGEVPLKVKQFQFLKGGGTCGTSSSSSSLPNIGEGVELLVPVPQGGEL